MAPEQQLAQEQVLYPNADKVGDFIESESDPTTRCLMRLAHEEFVRAVISGERPAGSVDMLYCFEMLKRAFSRKDALANALKGNYGDPYSDIEWT
jgi:hypothetical protein